MIKQGKSDRLIRNGENNIQNLEKILELMEEAAQCGFDVPSDWILKLKIEKGFFYTLKSDLDLSKIAMQKVVSLLESCRQTVAGKKYSMFEGPLIFRVKTHHSIFKKMWRKRNPQSNEPCHYRKFPDLCGVRVTVNYLDNIYEVMDYISFHRCSPANTLIINMFLFQIVIACSLNHLICAIM